MEFTTELKAFRDALTTAKAGIARNGALPVLSGVRLDAWPGTVELTTTNLDLTTKIRVDAQVAFTGTSVVNAAILLGALKGKGTVHISDDDDMLQVVNGVKHRILRLPTADWPKLVTVNGGFTRCVSVERLDHVAAAASSSDSRPILTGVLFTGDRLVATDSYRLHVDDLPGEASPSNVIIPADAILAVTKAARKAKEKTVTVHIGEREATFRVGAASWTTRLIEGAFPNYQQLIPTTVPIHIGLNKTQLVDALTPLSKFVRDSTTPVRLTFTDTDMVMTMNVQDMGDAVGTVPCTWELGRDLVGDDFVVAFNPSYLLQAAANLTGDTVTLQIIDRLKPSVVTDGPGALRLIMPVRVP